MLAPVPKFAASSFLLLLACACTVKRVQPEEVSDQRPCGSLTEVHVEHRTDGARVVVELRALHIECEGAKPDELVPVADISLPSPPSSCPVGQVALRTDRTGQAATEVLPEFVHTLSPEVVVEVSKALKQFTQPAEAFVIDCPMERNADWLLVEANWDPRARRGLLFLGNERSFARHHPRVSFAGEPPEPPPPVVAPPPPHIAAQCAGLEHPTWVGRFFSDGVTPGPHFLKTWALRRERDRATLVIESMRADKTKGTPLEWSCEASSRFEGTATESRGGLLFHSDAGMDVTCTWRSLRIANATAKRVSVPSDQEGCNKHRWSPAPSSTQRALVCTEKDGSERAFLASPPGLEHVTFDEDDCWDAADSLRAVGRDGGFAPVY
jgi:hypothetical protein